MEMQKILARLHWVLNDRGLTAAGVSRQATGSPDTIRNWERRAKSVKNPGATTSTLAPVAETLGVPLDWLLGTGPDDLTAYRGEMTKRARIIEIYDRLPEPLRDVALKQIAALAPASEPERALVQTPESD